MSKKVAVLTDAVSAGFHFPRWFSYYSTLFGSDNIFVFVPDENQAEFNLFAKCNFLSFSGGYNDDVRLEMITAKVSELLRVYDYVLRVDSDEFVVPDMRRWSDLPQYINGLDRAYVTAEGFDIFQHASESTSDASQALLIVQRRYAFALTAMNKTCLTSVPLTWNRGFHFTNEPPDFYGLYIFHLKRVDVAGQMLWNALMFQKTTRDEIIKEYYKQDQKKILQFHRDLSERQTDKDGWSLERREFREKFLATVERKSGEQFFTCDHYIENRNVIIPECYNGLF